MSRHATAPVLGRCESWPRPSFGTPKHTDLRSFLAFPSPLRFFPLLLLLLLLLLSLLLWKLLRMTKGEADDGSGGEQSCELRGALTSIGPTDIACGLQVFLLCSGVPCRCRFQVSAPNAFAACC